MEVTSGEAGEITAHDQVGTLRTELVHTKAPGSPGH